MAACTPTPTETLFTTTTISTVSVSTSISNELSTTGSTVTFTTTRCDAFNTTAGADPTCLSSTVVTSTAISDVITTIPHTILTSVPVFVTQTPPVRTLWATCPDQPIPDPTPSQSETEGPISSTTGGGSVIIVTSVSTYTDSNGIHTAISTMSNSNGSLNQGGDGNKSGGSLPAIIGGVVGGVLGLLAIIALIWYLLRRREQTRFMFDDDDDDMGGGKGGVYGAAAGMAGGRRGRTRSVNLEDEIKGADAHPYQYGLVGNTPSPHGSPAFHSQNSTMGYGTAHSGGHHQRNSSRDALMASGPASPSLSPRHLDVLLPIGQRRASQLTGSSSGAPDSIMMTNQQPMTHAVTNNNLGNRPSDERDAPWMGHHARPSSSLLEAPTTYPPGHNGFYQQYGPVEPAQPAQQRPPSASTTGGGSITGGGGVHKPPLEPSLAAAMRPVPAHQALYYAAGLQDPNSPLTHSNTMSSSRTQAHVMATPPPGAGGARQYPLSASTSVGASSVPGPGLGLGHAPNREGDIFSAVMASADHAAATATASPTPGAASPGEFGFGRQRRDGEKSPTPSSGPRSPVIQHRDGGRVPVGQQPSGEAPPPAYTDP